MKLEDQIKALAELDGWSPDTMYECATNIHAQWRRCDCKQTFKDFRYLTSYDAIIPLIQKQSPGIKIKIGQSIYANMGLTVRYSMSFQNAMNMLTTPPAQLCEALLRATNKWTEE